MRPGNENGEGRSSGSENAGRKKRKRQDNADTTETLPQWDIPKTVREIPTSQTAMAGVFNDFAQTLAQWAQRATETASASEKQITELCDMASLNEVEELRKKNAELTVELQEFQSLKQANDKTMRRNAELIKDLATKTETLSLLQTLNDRTGNLLAEAKLNLSVQAKAKEALELENSALKYKLEQQGAISENLRVELREMTVAAETFKQKLFELQKEIQNYFSTTQTGITAFLANVVPTNPED
ncbi:hypothetical protein MSAN_00946400 [Mycena sanguinolenta]|uniref:Uncharacterized protein n=1 Tax=Mycena sanguinolenta TaxID=230812 RepID=A0A8H6YXQ9_9AGAR|nr:hypothetical protein MSAN_00946400 [Mycena sanguinolenta]